MADQKESYKREIQNEDSEPTMVRAFDADHVDILASSDFRLDDSHDIRHVFVAIDPAAGGNRSKFAIVSLVTVDRPDAENLPQGVCKQDVVVHTLTLSRKIWGGYWFYCYHAGSER